MSPRVAVFALSFLLALPACAQDTVTPAEPAQQAVADVLTAPHVLPALNADRLAAALTQTLDQHPTARRTTVTLKVIDLETGDVLFDRDSDKLLTPASNLKIYTSAAALDLLGPEYRWTTKLSASGRLVQGTLHDGTVFFSGDGDPMLSASDLHSMVDRLLEAIELSLVKGRVVVSTSPWDQVPLKGPGWMWDDEPDYYNMSIQPVMLDFNTFEISVSPGEIAGDPAAVTLSPLFRVPVVENTAKTILDQESSAKIDRDPFTALVKVSGMVPKDGKAIEDRITMHDPSEWIASVLTVMLHERGVVIDPEIMTIDMTAMSHEMPGSKIVEHQGKSLAEAIKHFLKVSENAVGEMLLLKLAETFDEDGEVSWPAGAKVISDWLVNEAGLEAGSFRLVDGSGLSRYNLISADSSIRLLSYMKNESEHFEPFFDGLPIYDVKPTEVAEGESELTQFAGADGYIPLAEIDTERVFAKPGGMSGVSTISGYVKTYDGRWLAFSLLGNGYIGSSAPVRDLRDDVWAQLVRFRPEDN